MPTINLDEARVGEFIFRRGTGNLTENANVLITSQTSTLTYPEVASEQNKFSTTENNQGSCGQGFWKILCGFHEADFAGIKA